MRHALACWALVLVLVPARALAQYPGANVRPGPGVGVTVNASVGAPVSPTVSVNPGTSVNPAVVVTPSANVSAAPSVSPGAGVAYGGNQQDQAYYYLYLSVLYDMQGAYAATPEGRAQVSRGVSEYFSNGAAVTSVPTTGPTADYFTNGAQATTGPTSVMPDYTFSPPLATASPWTVETPPPPPPPAVVEAGAPAAAVPAEEAAPAETGAVAAEPAYAPAPAYAPEATAIPAARPPASTPAPAPTPTPVTPPAPEPAPHPVTHGVPATTIIWPMVGGIAIGAFLVLLGTRIRPRAPST